MENQTIQEYPENNSEEGAPNDTSYKTPLQHRGSQSYSHQQLHNGQRNSLTFINPWGSNLNGSSDLFMQSNQSLLSTSSENQRRPSMDDFKRRKSSIVIPPSRAPGINPYFYNIDTTATFNGDGTSDNFQQNQNIDANQQQKKIFADEKDLYVQALLDPSSGIYDPDAFYRRRSLAAPAFTSSMGSSSMNTANNTATTNASSYQLNEPISPSNVNFSLMPHGCGINSRQPNRTGSFRKLSAYGAPVQSTFKSTYREEYNLLQQPPLEIPQMTPCNSKSDLQPTLNKLPKYRRASLHSSTISPLVGLTKGLITTYSLCSSDFQYKTSKNPRRVLTKPNEGVANNGYDNVNSDYILYVNDVLGTEQNRKYLVLDILGQGTFGQVVKCQNILTKEIIAVKVVKSRMEYLNQSISEAKILELINQKIDPYDKHHFLRLHDTFVHKNHLCLVFELLSSNLYEILKQNRFHGLNLSIIKEFSKQLLESLAVLKCSKIVHCDLKPENILLSAPDKPEIKVIDFGSSCEERKTLYTYIQSRFYRSPEVILGIPYSTSIDMWSFGCIVAELFLGIPIFPGASEFNQITRIINSLDYPPSWMIDRGKNSAKYFSMIDANDMVDSDTSGLKYRLKTVDQFNKQFNAQEKPSKQYFKWDKLHDIIKNYRLPKHIQNHPELIENEMKERECLIHFLQGVLNINPLERWTPQQASMHPFITGQPFSKDWYPLGSLPSSSSIKDQSRDSNYILESGSSSVVSQRRSTLQESANNSNNVNAKSSDHAPKVGMEW
ncbi:hypothetical protein TBLA_0B06510 [Henningerozyma blattae CBS 6284]|uniref:Protein kinase domain-containing protein n=1 Tax=Henningerozyma blattae (strain ATCC 34711 / CBS 6284 / DSM 70876 / NBRC 10599 / NRRL Y-10934 / UCD 77-7) TaxID=1071380 RepID=I2GZC2_HENB6|nr:hypothetical protein TBLA_0B06510 [Tetrapisispora blattae CBS 6284]CCH59474.1 hypothetical protein TBLA_0B06510 [Tetrapisispora blattae CBS 6284]